jgi:hypothetical protein
MSDVENFFHLISEEVIQEAADWSIGNEAGTSFKESAFAKLVCEDMSLAGVVESPTVCFHEFPKGNGTAKVNAYSLPDEDGRLDLVICDYRVSDALEKINQSDIEKRINQANRFIESSLVEDGYRSLDPSNDVYDMMKTIYDHRGAVDRVNVIIATNCLSVSRKEKIPSKKVNKYEVSYEIWDIERYRRFRSSGSTQEELEVDIQEYLKDGLSCVTRPAQEHGYLSSVAIFPGKILYELYDKYGSRLLELNVRSYLQARGKINKGILQTIITEPEKFLTYNNGITVVASDVVYNEQKTKILSIKGMQIVNGGQTTASIHRAVKENKVSVDDVYVQSKITVVPVDEFEDVVPSISRYSNTQNKVSDVDLRANHPYHVGLERVSRRTWAPGETSMWFYERARGGYQTERSKCTTKPQRNKFDNQYPPTFRITKEDVARYENIWDGHPHIVSKGGQKNFTKFMEKFGATIKKDWEPSLDEYKSLIAKAIFYRSVQQIAKELNIPAFRVNIVNYTASVLVDKTAKRINLREIWDKQAISVDLSEQIRLWIPKIQELMLKIATGRNPGEVFKEESCWKKVVDVVSDWPLDDSLSKSLVSITGSSSSSSADFEVENSIAKCTQVSAKEWFEISVWGGQTNNLEVWQIGIANTLAGYAAANWVKKPSEKQAIHGLKILSMYKQKDD